MKEKKNVLNFTGERLVTQLANDDTIYHLHRYAIPMQYINNKVVVDIASGEGYGSNLISQKAKRVYGIDISKEAVDFASYKYETVTNLSFQVGSVEQIPLDNACADVVISFETLEHTDKHHEMMREVKRILKPSGLFIISSPDKANYSDQYNRINPYHVKELYFKEFKMLLNQYFDKTSFYYQKFVTGSLIIGEDFKTNSLVEYTGDYLTIDSFSALRTPLFNIAICSDKSFEAINASYFDGEEVMRNMYLQRAMNFTPFRLGNFILKPLRIFKSLFKQ